MNTVRKWYSSYLRSDMASWVKANPTDITTNWVTRANLSRYNEIRRLRQDSLILPAAPWHPDFIYTLKSQFLLQACSGRWHISVLVIGRWVWLCCRRYGCHVITTHAEVWDLLPGHRKFSSSPEVRGATSPAASDWTQMRVAHLLLSLELGWIEKSFVPDQPKPAILTHCSSLSSSAVHLYCRPGMLCAGWKKLNDVWCSVAGRDSSWGSTQTFYIQLLVLLIILPVTTEGKWAFPNLKPV